MVCSGLCIVLEILISSTIHVKDMVVKVQEHEFEKNTKASIMNSNSKLRAARNQLFLVIHNTLVH